MDAVASRPRGRAPAAVRDGDTRLYDLVALALGVYARSRFRLRLVGAPFSLEPRTVVAATHRGDDDVPVAIAALYRSAHGLLRRNGGIHFAVRNDLFAPGFFAGYPPGVPRWLRRVLFGVDVGPVLRRLLPCHPVRNGRRLRVVELLRALPDAPLDELLPAELFEPLLARARAFGRDQPFLARDVLHGDYADLLWEIAGPDELDSLRAGPVWRARRLAATAELRALCEVLRGGGSLFICPEGRPSPDGSIGPLLGGVGPLVRRGEPERLVPVALAYDPLVAGRTHALVGVGRPVEPVADPDVLLALLRRASPLTVGSSVAAARADGADASSRLAADLEAARAEGRPYDPELDDPDVRAERLAVAGRLAEGRNLLRLVNEYRSARA